MENFLIFLGELGGNPGILTTKFDTLSSWSNVSPIQSEVVFVYNSKSKAYEYATAIQAQKKKITGVVPSIFIQKIDKHVLEKLEKEFEGKNVKLVYEGQSDFKDLFNEALAFAKRPVL